MHEYSDISNTGNLREEILNEAKIDWIVITLGDNNIYLGDVFRSFIGLDSECISVEESLRYFDKCTVNDMKNYIFLLASGAVACVTIPLKGESCHGHAVNITVTSIDDTKQLLRGYIYPFNLAARKVNIASMKQVSIKGEDKENKMAFLSDMSHEIRTHVNAIVGFSRLLASAETIAERDEYMHIIEDNNEMLLQLINDILDISKIESGTLDFKMTSFNLTTLMNEIYSSATLRVQNNDVSVILDDIDDDIVICSDKHRVTQVLNNFINNAIKFTKKGTITIGCSKRRNDYYFFVTDTGFGIDKKSCDTIFERFKRLHTEIRGNGLGLPICKSIVNHLNGSIGVESELGKGSTFWFTLPFNEIDNDGLNKTDSGSINSPTENLNKKRGTILIAEDDPSNYKLCEVILSGSYNLAHAWNGKEAVEMFPVVKPDLVLMDINMPIMNGYEATDEIRKISWTVPIVASTAYALADDEEKIMASGFDGYISKPVNVSKLKEILEKLYK